MWYQASNFQLQSAKDFLSSIINLPSIKQSHLFPDNDPVLAEKVKEDIKEEYRRVCAQEVLDPKAFEIMVIFPVKHVININYEGL